MLILKKKEILFTFFPLSLSTFVFFKVFEIFINYEFGGLGIKMKRRGIIQYNSCNIAMTERKWLTRLKKIRNLRNNPIPSLGLYAITYFITTVMVV